jgi:hypothetical protein
MSEADKAMPPGRKEAEQEILLASVKHLLRFAAVQAVVELKSELIEATVKATTVTVPFGPDQEAQLWKMHNDLAALVHPARPESITAIDDLAADRKKRPQFWRCWTKDAPVRGQINGSIVWVLAVLVPLVVLQCYSLTVSSILTTIEDTEKKLGQSKTEIAKIQAQLDIAESAKVSTVGLQKEFDDKDDQKKNDERIVTASYAMLLKVTSWWSGLFITDNPADANNAEKQITKELNIRAASTALLNALSLYFLPLMYGLLGANVYILRQLISKLDLWNLDTLSASKHHLRRALGVLLGAIVGLIFNSNDSAIQTTGFGLATLAFLAGYSAEFIFSLLDTFIDRAKGTFADKEKYEPKTPRKENRANEQEKEDKGVLKGETGPTGPTGATGPTALTGETVQ